MEQTDKQKAIEAAYGEYWEINKENIDENGWINCFLFPELAGNGVQEDSECGFFVRPKSLQGLETNNGWIRIESESDLPKEECQCFIIVKGEVFFDYYNGNDFDLYVKSYVTHYQPITKPKPPIY